MQFDDTDLDIFLDAFEAQDYPVTLNDVQIGTLRGIYRRATEFLSPHSAEQLVIHPSLECKAVELAAYNMTHRVTVDGIKYKFWREPVPSDSGFSVVGLVKA